MKKFFILSALILAASYASACTNFIVGKDASVDGSVICTYTADDYGMFIGLQHFPAGTHKKGEMRDVVDWDTHVYHGKSLRHPLPIRSTATSTSIRLPLVRQPVAAVRR